MYKIQQRGMTLIEVLIALAIIAIALMAVIQTTGMSTKQLTRVQEVALAQWVAKNAATRLQLGFEAHIAQGAFQGTETMLGRNFYWAASLNPLPNREILAIEVKVSEKQGGKILNEFTSYTKTTQE